MTTETQDYETLTDRELDALVAWRVMGRRTEAVDDDRGGVFLVFARTEDDPFIEEAQHYSTDPGAAFTVLEAMRAQGTRWRVVCDPLTAEGVRDGYYIEVMPWPGDVYSAHDDSMPRAVAIAALRAKDAEATR